MLQQLVVFAIVCGAAGYAIWSLVPPARRWFGGKTATGCASGCDGCGSAPAKTTTSEHPIRIVRRVPGGR